jgi:preprotein translocase subunit SecG
MHTAWLVLQIIITVLLSAAILLQAQGTGLGASWGGGGETYHTRRGLEKVLFYATIVLAVAFTATSLIVLLTQ